MIPEIRAGLNIGGVAAIHEAVSAVARVAKPLRVKGSKLKEPMRGKRGVIELWGDRGAIIQGAYQTTIREVGELRNEDRDHSVALRKKGAARILQAFGAKAVQ